MKDKDTPLALVRLWSKLDKDCYRQLDRCKAAKDRGELSWPDYCPLPINAAATYLQSVHKTSDLQVAAGCAELTACWAWRQNKIVYAFDPDMAAALASQVEDVADTDILPAELLMHLPYPCIYIKAPGLLEYMDGFWAWVDFDTNREAPELRIQWVFDTMDASVPQVIHIIPGATILECILDTLQTTLEHTREPVDISRPLEGAQIVLMAIQLLLYLLADNADIDDAPAPQIHVINSRKTRQTGETSIQDKAGEVKAKNVGVRIGAAFRRSRAGSYHGTSAGTGNAKRPHMRRGHWHHYWRGQKDARELTLKWTAPTMIHADVGDLDNVIVYPVKGEK